MSSEKRHGTMNPYGNKSKYFYLRDIRKRKNHHRCQHCGTNECAPDLNHCDRCRDHKRHDHSLEDQFEMVGFDSDAAVSQNADQFSFMDQESAELIWIKESCDIKVDSRDTQIALSLQASLQLAIALVLSLSIADSSRGEAISQDLLQQFNSDQINKQKIFICNTKDANVTTRDTDIAINIQVLLQVLITLVIMVDIL